MLSCKVYFCLSFQYAQCKALLKSCILDIGNLNCHFYCLLCFFPQNSWQEGNFKAYISGRVYCRSRLRFGMLQRTLNSNIREAAYFVSKNFKFLQMQSFERGTLICFVSLGAFMYCRKTDQKMTLQQAYSLATPCREFAHLTVRWDVRASQLGLNHYKSVLFTRLWKSMRAPL